MTTVTRTFEYNGAKVTVQRPNGFTKVKHWQMISAVTGHEDLSPIASEVGSSLLYYLANTIHVDGDLGFPVPTSNATADDLAQFINNLGEADESLTVLWDNELMKALTATNDPDLLPPESVEKKGSKTKK